MDLCWSGSLLDWLIAWSVDWLMDWMNEWSIDWLIHWIRMVDWRIDCRIATDLPRATDGYWFVFRFAVKQSHDQGYFWISIAACLGRHVWIAARGFSIAGRRTCRGLQFTYTHRRKRTGAFVVGWWLCGHAPCPRHGAKNDEFCVALNILLSYRIITSYFRDNGRKNDGEILWIRPCYYASQKIQKNWRKPRIM